MGKAYCRKCKKTLSQVLSSFECLATWNRDEEFYEPEDNCNLIRRCPNCGSVTKDLLKKIAKKKEPSEGLVSHGWTKNFVPEHQRRGLSAKAKGFVPQRHRIGVRTKHRKVKV